MMTAMPPRRKPRVKNKPVSSRHLFAPEIVADVEGPWTCIPTKLHDAKVSKESREAHIPPPYTKAQKLARLHELAHVRNSPRNWLEVRTRVLSMGDANGIDLNSQAVVKLSKMLEENRIDWWLWEQRGIDMRECRESLHWDLLPLPDDDPLEATCMVLQLAWTVWGSTDPWRGKINNMPESREPEEGVEAFFKGCWSIVNGHSRELGRAVLKALFYIYTDPTDDTRDECAYELAQFFSVEEDYEQPEPTPEEQEAQQEAEEEANQEEESRQEDSSGGNHNDVENRGHWQYHDHTKGRRRHTLRIRRRFTPIDQGFMVKYPGRYLLDRFIFGRRSRTTGSVLIDLSGSMTWKNEDMLELLESMPQLWIGGYAGYTIPGIQGRLCIFAKDGKFNEFTGLEPECNGGNSIDLEALQVLAKQPEPRIWLSDGGVCGGILANKPYPGLEDNADAMRYPHLQLDGRIIYEVNRIMKRTGIIRVHFKDDLIKLFHKQLIQAYKSSVMSDDAIEKQHPGRSWSTKAFYGSYLQAEPITFSL